MTVLQWVTTSLIATIVAYIAYRQWKTANYRLKLDLFERRFSVFKATESLLDSVSGDGWLEKGGLGRYRRTIEHSPFLFPKNLTDYLEEVCKRVRQIDRNNRQWSKAVHDKTFANEKEELERKDKEFFDWLDEAQKALVDRFRPYLDFRDIR